MLQDRVGADEEALGLVQGQLDSIEARIKQLGEWMVFSGRAEVFFTGRCGATWTRSRSVSAAGWVAEGMGFGVGVGCGKLHVWNCGVRWKAELGVR